MWILGDKAERRGVFPLLVVEIWLQRVVSPRSGIIGKKVMCSPNWELNFSLMSPTRQEFARKAAKTGSLTQLLNAHSLRWRRRHGNEKNYIHSSKIAILVIRRKKFIPFRSNTPSYSPKTQIKEERVLISQQWIPVLATTDAKIVFTRIFVGKRKISGAGIR